VIPHISKIRKRISSTLLNKLALLLLILLLQVAASLYATVKSLEMDEVS